ncbi:MAG: ribokinase [Chloroflexi bacterium]|nr:MAG: ribokinase [Chloroflexota bacterium]
MAIASRFPEPGETILGKGFQATPGGKGANQAVAAARLGARTMFIGRVGKDAFGDALVHELQTNGVDIKDLAREDGVPTGIAHIQVDEAGQNKIIIAPGANAGCGALELDRLLRVLPRTDALLLQMELPAVVSLEAAREAKEFGCSVILDPAPASPLPDEEYPLLDVILPNETEATILTGVTVTGPATAREAALRIQGRGVSIVVVKLGDQGAYYLGPTDEGHLPAMQVEVVDSVGAGDAFSAAFAVASAEGASLVEAVLWGNAAGALAVTQRGAQRAMPHRRDLLNLLKSTPESGQ